MQLIDILQGANVALRILAVRLVLILTLLLTFGLFAWAMAAPDVLRCMIAFTWGLTIFLPVLFAGGGAHHAAERQSQRPEDGASGGSAEAGP